MNIVIAATAMICAAVLFALFWLLRHLVVSGRAVPATIEWIDELSVERYRPMMHLLDSGDLEFLRSQPGFTSEAVAKLRKQRCQIFRGYLRSLTSDFWRVCGGIRLLMVQSKCDRPDLAAALLRHQVLFTWGLIAVQMRLVLYRFGVCGVDVTAVVGLFDAMRLELRSLMPASATTGA